MNRVAFSIFGINVYYYSLFILTGVLIGYYLITKESKKHKIDSKIVSDFIFYTLLVGIIGARVYYIIFNLDYYIQNPIEIIKIYNGGLAIHGGVISGLIFSFFYLKKKNINYYRMLDICTPALILAQGIGRWGNFFNGEAHGGITTLSNLKSLFIPDFVINGMKIDGIYYFPTFYFESILCIIGFIIIMIIRKNKNIKVGFQIGFYFIYYGIVRFIIESFRTDSLMLLNIKMAQIVSILGIITGIILIVLSRNKEKYFKEEEV